MAMAFKTLGSPLPTGESTDLNGNGKFVKRTRVPGSISEPFVITQFDDPDTPVDESGWYEFDDLLPGSYAVAEELQTDGTTNPVGASGVTGAPDRIRL